MSSYKYFLRNILILILVLPTIYFLYNLVYLDRIYPNNYFAGTRLIEKRSEVDDLVVEKLQSFEKSKIIFSIEGQRVETDTNALGIEFDPEKTTLSILEFGRSGNLKNDMRQVLGATFKDTHFVPVYNLDLSKLSLFFDNLAQGHENAAKNATIRISAGEPEIVPAENGRVVNRAKLVSGLLTSVENLSGEIIPVDLIEEQPLIRAPQAADALERLKVLAKQQITLSFDNEVWKLDGKTLFDMLKFYPSGYESDYLLSLDFGADRVVVDSVNFPDAELFLDVSLDSEKMMSFINNVALDIDRPTVDSTLRFENGKVVEFRPAVDGQNLDRELTRELLLEKVSVTNPSAENFINVSLPVSVTQSKVASEEINSLGIHTLVGKGISYFSGSISNRVSNLTLAAARMSGTLIPPGGTFSFNKSVGEVSGATGYKKAYVISQGRTILDDGGGVCQVSTTVFRAALNSGLPIISRTAHAYRVGYYEQKGFGPGLDATVWSPAVDLQFKNDTNHHLLIQATVDPRLSKLEVDIYGTGDGRRVEISNPVVSNITPALPDKYEDDPSLPKGVVKQVDFAAAGATAIFKRKVFRQDDLIVDESFTSRYRPWQAVFLVGTGS